MDKMDALHELIAVPVDVQTLPSRGRRVTFSADETVRAALARELMLEGVVIYEGAAELRPWVRKGVEVTGCVSATIQQACSVTLKPVEQVIEEEFSLQFVPESSKLSRDGKAIDGELVLDPDGKDPPELFDGRIIDVGSIWLEFFVLGIDPHPRDPSVTLQPIVGLEEDEADADSPFSVLAKLKKH